MAYYVAITSKFVNLVTFAPVLIPLQPRMCVTVSLCFSNG